MLFKLNKTLQDASDGYDAKFLKEIGIRFNIYTAMKRTDHWRIQLPGVGVQALVYPDRVEFPSRIYKYTNTPSILESLDIVMRTPSSNKILGTEYFVAINNKRCSHVGEQLKSIDINGNMEFHMKKRIRKFDRAKAKEARAWLSACIELLWLYSTYPTETSKEGLLEIKKVQCSKYLTTLGGNYSNARVSIDKLYLEEPGYVATQTYYLTLSARSSWMRTCLRNFEYTLRNPEQFYRKVGVVVYE